MQLLIIRQINREAVHISSFLVKKIDSSGKLVVFRDRGSPYPCRQMLVGWVYGGNYIKFF